MKLLKIFAIVVAAFVALSFLLPLFLPSGYTVERSIVVEKPVAEVYPNVIDFEKFTQWDPWSPQDPDAENTLTGEMGEVGSMWAWKGEILGKGSMTLKSQVPEQQAVFVLQFYEPFESVADNTFTFEEKDGKTTVKWLMTAETGYFGRYMNPMMDSMLGADFEKGLETLKTFTENRQ